MAFEVDQVIGSGSVQMLICQPITFPCPAEEVKEIRKTVIVDNCMVVFDKVIIDGRLRKGNITTVDTTEVNVVAAQHRGADPADAITWVLIDEPGQAAQYQAERGMYRATIICWPGTPRSSTIELIQGGTTWDRRQSTLALADLQVAAERWLQGGPFYLIQDRPEP
ncbi:MAG TPA: hypothetical protein VD973_21650 [Symbiobacteriaceae bacterium]|nr:hypothetical protein [Symbiobacteriaceae bacterium]